MPSVQVAAGEAGLKVPDSGWVEGNWAATLPASTGWTVPRPRHNQSLCLLSRVGGVRLPPADKLPWLVSREDSDAQVQFLTSISWKCKTLVGS